MTEIQSLKNIDRGGETGVRDRGSGRGSRWSSEEKRHNTADSASMPSSVVVFPAFAVATENGLVRKRWAFFLCRWQEAAETWLTGTWVLCNLLADG